MEGKAPRSLDTGSFNRSKVAITAMASGIEIFAFSEYRNIITSR